MGYYEKQLKSIVASDGFDMPNAARLSSELNQVAALLGKIQGSPGWTGSSAESAKEKMDSLRRQFAKAADMTDEVRRNYRYANSDVDDAAQALDKLPTTAHVRSVDAASNSMEEREAAAKAAVEAFEAKLYVRRAELRTILGPFGKKKPAVESGGPTPVPVFGGVDSSGSGGSGGSGSTGVGGSGSGGGYSGRSSVQSSVVQSSAADVPVSYSGSAGTGSTGSGSGVGDVHRLRPDGSLSPSDPRGIEGHASGGLSGDRSGSGGGVGSGRVDLGGRSATAGFGGGGIGAGILGAGGVGAGAKLASGGLKGLSGGTGSSAGSGAGTRLGAGGIGSASGAGARLVGGGTGGIGSASGGGARLGGAGGLSGAGGGLSGAGGGLSGAAASSAVNGGSSANIGAAGGATGTGGGGVGVMGGGGGQGASQERGRTRGLGGIIAPKIEDDELSPFRRRRTRQPRQQLSDVIEQTTQLSLSPISRVNNVSACTTASTCTEPVSETTASRFCPRLR